MSAQQQYKKVSRFNLKGNKHNFGVFLNEIHQSPLKAAGIAIIFASLAIAIMVVDTTGSVKFSKEWQSWVLFSISSFVSLFFIYHTFVGFIQKENE